MNSNLRQEASRFRIRAWIKVLVFLVLVGLGMAWWLGLGPSEWRRLRNGWDVRFDGVSFGRSHGYPPGNRLLQYLHRHPPKWMMDHFGFKPIEVYCGNAQRENLCFWLRWRCPPVAVDNVVEMMADETGHESHAFEGGIGMAAPDNTLLYTHYACVWPSSRRVALRFYEHQPDGDLVPLAEFRVRNPARNRPRASWTPESLPAVRTNGDLTVVLEGFGHDPLPARPDWRRRSTARPLPFLRLRTLQSGQPSSGWQVRRITLSDGAANDLPFETFSFPTNGQEIVPLTINTSEAAEVPCVLWPGAKAWKVRLLLGIRSGIQFATNEVCTLSRLVLNRYGEGRYHSEANASWGRFNLNVMLGDNPDVFANWLPNANSLLEISLGEHLPDTMLAVVEAQDQKGRRVAVGPAYPNSFGYHGDSMSTWWKLPLLVEPNAGHLTLSFGIMTNRVVEFVVPAPDFPPAKPFAVPP
jgi:hypothetical protein